MRIRELAWFCAPTNIVCVQRLVVLLGRPQRPWRTATLTGVASSVVWQLSDEVHLCMVYTVCVSVLELSCVACYLYIHAKYAVCMRKLRHRRYIRCTSLWINVAMRI